MIYRADPMVLSEIRVILRGQVNDVAVCEDLNSPVRACYTVVTVKDRACAKKLLSVLEHSEKGLPEGVLPYGKLFSQDGLLCFVSDYRPERHLNRFGESQLVTPSAQECVCVNLVMECLSSPLPYPLLYLALEDDNVHVEKDNSVYFTPNFNLERLDEHIGEAGCTARCVQIMLHLLQGSSRRRLKSFELLRKKLERGAYRALPELYRDVRMTMIPARKPTLREKLTGFWRRNRDGLFRALLVLCVLIAAAALIVLISQLIFGDVPLFRLFEHSFDRIGTEQLN